MSQNLDPRNLDPSEQLLLRLNAGLRDIERLLQPDSQLTADQRRGLGQLSSLVQATIEGQYWTYPAGHILNTSPEGVVQLAQMANHVAIGGQTCGTAYRYRNGSASICLSHDVEADPIIHTGHVSINVSDYEFAVKGGKQDVYCTAYIFRGTSRLETASEPTVIPEVSTHLADAVEALVQALVPDPSQFDENLAELAGFEPNPDQQ